MPDEDSPRLRTVEKGKPPYPLNKFPADFPTLLGREIVYLLATKQSSSLEGSEWEQIFATCIGADWKPSNVGLDDVIIGNCAWGAKTVKVNKPTSIERARLISGRNSPVYSYGDNVIKNEPPNKLGRKILKIWNERVSSLRQKFKHLRTIVLIKSEDLLTLCVFEFDTIMYTPSLFRWSWNEKGNLEGFNKKNEHRFTWQPHGSQFTIIEAVPPKSIIIQLKEPRKLKKDEVLQSLGFDQSWVTVKRRDG